MTFEFNVSNTTLAPVSEISLVRGNENYYRFKFNFLTPDWDGLSQSAIFVCGETSARVPIENGECAVPTEIVGGKSTAAGGAAYFGVVGYLGTNDSENGDSAEIAKSTESAGSTKSTENTENTENTESTENTEASSIAKVDFAAKSAENSDAAETTESAENSENAKVLESSAASQSDFIRISTDLTYLPIQEGAYRKASDSAVPSSDIWEKYYAEISRASSFAKEANDACNAAKASADDAESSKNSAAQALSDLLSMIGTDIATLINGKIPASQIPSIATTEIYTAKSKDEMDAITAERGDICIRSDENLSYIYSGGWVTLVSPTDYVSRAGHAETASSAENAAKINGHRLVKMTESEFSTAVLDDNTFYLVY